MTDARDMEQAGETVRAARISDCGVYRYTLSRAWGSTRVGFSPLAFVMLNPSTADASLDDPTIRRCMGFAKREGARGMVVMNLFALRATDPDELKTAADPVGPENDAWLTRMLGDGYATVVCAWGSHPLARARGLAFAKLMGNRPLHCLGVTKDGSPRHPLYLPSAAPLERWSPRTSGAAHD